MGLLHTIFFIFKGSVYLSMEDLFLNIQIDPEGSFVDYYGQTKDADAITSAVLMQMKKYEQLQKKSLMAQIIS